MEQGQTHIGVTAAAAAVGPTHLGMPVVAAGADEERRTLDGAVPLGFLPQPQGRAPVVPSAGFVRPGVVLAAPQQDTASVGNQPPQPPPPYAPKRGRPPENAAAKTTTAAVPATAASTTRRAAANSAAAAVSAARKPAEKPPPPPKRTAAVRRAAARKGGYNEDDDDADENEDENAEDDEEQSDVGDDAADPPSKPAPQAPSGRPNRAAATRALAEKPKAKQPLQQQPAKSNNSTPGKARPVSGSGAGGGRNDKDPVDYSTKLPIVLDSPPHHYRWCPGLRPGDLAWTDVEVCDGQADGEKEKRKTSWPVQVVSRWISFSKGVNDEHAKALTAMQDASLDRSFKAAGASGGGGFDMLATIAMGRSAGLVPPLATEATKKEDVEGGAVTDFAATDGAAAPPKADDMDVDPPDAGAQGSDDLNVATPTKKAPAAESVPSTAKRNRQRGASNVVKPAEDEANVLMDPTRSPPAPLYTHYVVRLLPIRNLSLSSIDGASCVYRAGEDVTPFSAIPAECTEDVLSNVATLQALDISSSWGVLDEYAIATSSISGGAVEGEAEELAGGIWSDIVERIKMGQVVGQDAVATMTSARRKTINPKDMTDTLNLMHRRQILGVDGPPLVTLRDDEEFVTWLRLGPERIRVGDLVRLTAKPSSNPPTNVTVHVRSSKPRESRTSTASNSLDPNNRPFNPFSLQLPGFDGHEYIEISHLIVTRPPIPVLLPWRITPTPTYLASPRPVLRAVGRIHHAVPIPTSSGTDINQLAWCPESQFRIVTLTTAEVACRVHAQFPASSVNNVCLGFPTSSSVSGGGAVIGGMVGVHPRSWSMEEGAWDAERWELDDSERRRMAKRRRREIVGGGGGGLGGGVAERKKVRMATRLAFATARVIAEACSTQAGQAPGNNAMTNGSATPMEGVETNGPRAVEV